MDLLDRINDVLRRRGWTMRQWCRAAGVSENYLASFADRATRSKSAGLDASNAVALARAAGVTVEWLITGENTTVFDLDQRLDPLYPSRSIALAAAHLWHYPAVVTERLLAIDDFATDPGVDQWLQLLRTLYADHHSRQRGVASQ